MSESRQCPGYGCGASLRDGYLCRTCQRKAERIIGDLPALAHEVETTVSRQDRVASSGGRSTGPQPSPVNLSASDRARRAFDLLFEWADAVAAWHGVKGLPLFAAHLPLTRLVPPAVAILLSRSDWMRLNDDGPNLAEAVWCIQRDVRSIIDRPAARTYAGPCNTTLEDGSGTVTCRFGLYRKWGSDTITCDGHLDPDDRVGCGTIHAAVDRDKFLVAAVEDELLPLKLVWESLYVLLPGCQVDWHTARQWPRRHGSVAARLHERTVTVLGVALYRGGDILDLARDAAPRVGRRRTRRSADVA